MIEELMVESVTVEPFQSTNEHGVATYGASVSAKARFELKNVTFTNADGDQAQSDAIAYLPASVNAVIKSRLTYDGETYRVEQRKTHSDLDGPVFQRLMLERLV